MSGRQHRQNLNINNPLHFRVPFICKFKPGIPGIFSPSNYEEVEDDDDYNAESEEIDQLGEEMYSLKVQLVSDDEKRSTLLEKRTDSAMVMVEIMALSVDLIETFRRPREIRFTW